MAPTPLPADAVLVTADLREIPLRVTLPASPTFTIHHANGEDQIFALQRSSFPKVPGVIVYVEKRPDEPSTALFVPLKRSLRLAR